MIRKLPYRTESCQVRKVACLLTEPLSIVAYIVTLPYCSAWASRADRGTRTASYGFLHTLTQKAGPREPDSV